MKRVAIAGYGVENRALLKVLMGREPQDQYVIFDEADSLSDMPDNVELVLGSQAFSSIDAAKFDVVYRLSLIHI